MALLASVRPCRRTLLMCLAVLLFSSPPNCLTLYRNRHQTATSLQQCIAACHGLEGGCYSALYRPVNRSCQLQIEFADCAEIRNDTPTARSGVYRLRGGLDVYCDMDAAGHGWTVILKRYDGSVNFNLTWSDLRHKVGSESTEYWLGLEEIHAITSRRQYRLKVDLEFHNNGYFAEYNDFFVDSESMYYKLRVGGFQNASTAGDSLLGHSGMNFSTFDRDNDMWGGSCAINFNGAWWHRACHTSNLLAPYTYTVLNEGNMTTYGDFMSWYYYPNGNTHYVALKAVVMKIR